MREDLGASSFNWGWMTKTYPFSEAFLHKNLQGSDTNSSGDRVTTIGASVLSRMNTGHYLTMWERKKERNKRKCQRKGQPMFTKKNSHSNHQMKSRQEIERSERERDIF